MKIKKLSICKCCKQIIFNRNNNAKSCKECSGYHKKMRVVTYNKNNVINQRKKLPNINNE